MDIQAEKLQLIEWLVRLNDIKIIEELKSLKKETDKGLFGRYTERDFIRRAESSIEDIGAGRTINLIDFKTDIESWQQSKSTK